MDESRDGCVHTIEESGAKDLCPFCRTSPANSDEEDVKRVKKLMEKGNGGAFFVLGGCYSNGTYGMPQDHAKANELYLKAGELGCAEAYFNLGVVYRQGDGVEIDEKKAKNYFELAAMNGHVHARHNLGNNEYRTGNYHSQTEYIFTRLNEVKPEMIEEATRKAREVAEKFASDSQSKLGKIKNASQGQFSIYARDKNNPHIKKVRVVSTVQYYLSD